MKKPKILTPEEQLKKQEKIAGEFSEWVSTSFDYWKNRLEKNPKGSLAEIKLQIDSIAENIDVSKGSLKQSNYAERVTNKQYIDAQIELMNKLQALVDEGLKTKPARKPSNWTGELSPKCVEELELHFKANSNFTTNEFFKDAHVKCKNCNYGIVQIDGKDSKKPFKWRTLQNKVKDKYPELYARIKGKK